MGVTPTIRIKPKAFLVVLLASIIAAALVVLAMVLLGEYTKTRGRLLITALYAGGFSLLALAPSVLAQRGRYFQIATGGLLAPFLGFLLVVVGTWATPDPDAFWKAVAISAIVAVLLSYLCWLLLLHPRRWPARIARQTALWAAGTVLLLTSLAIIVEIRAAAFWWTVTLLIIAQVAAGLVAWALNRRLFILPAFHQPCAGELSSTDDSET